MRIIKMIWHRKPENPKFTDSQQHSSRSHDHRCSLAVRPRPALCRRPDPVLDGGLPGPPAAQSQPDHRHLLRQEAGLPVLRSVREAETQLLNDIGKPPTCPSKACRLRWPCRTCCSAPTMRLPAASRIATLQTHRRLGRAEGGWRLPHRCFPEASIWVSDPTWENHRAMFEVPGLEVSTYPYYDPATGGLASTTCWRRLSTLPAAASC